MTDFDFIKLNELKATYKLAKLNLDLVRQMDEDIKTKVLLSNEFYVDEEKGRRCGDKPQRILKPFMDFLMSDEDFEIYIDLLYKEYVKAGIADKRGRGYCPDNEARDELHKAEDELITYWFDLMPSDIGDIHIDKDELKKAVKNIKYREKTLEIIMGNA